MSAPRIMFSVNDYDRDGDVSEQGIYLHMGPVRVRVGDNVFAVRQIARNLEDIADEIEDSDAHHGPERTTHAVQIASAYLALEAERDALLEALGDLESICRAIEGKRSLSPSNDAILRGTLRKTRRALVASLGECASEFLRSRNW